MPRVVPSQVVATIDQLFEFAANQQGAKLLYGGSSAYVSAVLALVEQVPSELIQLDAPDYASLTLNLAVMRNAVTIWQAGNQGWALVDMPGFAGLNPITVVRGLMAKCPDSLPSPQTAELLPGAENV